MSAQRTSGAAAAHPALLALAARPEVSASLLLAYLAHFERHGTTALVRARLAPSTAHLLEHPPAPSAWLPRSVLDDLYAAVARDGGDEAVHALALETGLRTHAPLMRRALAHGALPAGSDEAPAALLGSLGPLLALHERGVHHVYTPYRARAGRMDVHLTEPASRLGFVAWEALYGLALETAGQAGSVALVQVSDGGRHGRYHLLW